MRAFWEIVRLELRRLWRSRAVHALVILSAAWVLATPHLLKSDGSPGGARELYIHFSAGGAFAITLIALASSAASSLAKERETKRLQLTLVRPVRFFHVALARIFALSLVAAANLAVAFAILAATVDLSVPCAHVISPVMMSPREEAVLMYDEFMKDPETPPEIRRTKKSIVLRLLTQKALDNYQSIAPGETAQWEFAAGGTLDEGSKPNLSVRLRFTNDFDLREEVRGTFRYGAFEGVVSNMTQSVIKVPLARNGDLGAADAKYLTFKNEGATSLMLRPRRDINLLVEADSFFCNLLRAYFELLAVATLTIAFAMLLGAGLGRSVAVFTCISFIFASVVSGDVIEQYPDQLETDRVDRIGLAITRAVQFASRPVASLHPLASLASDEMVETGETLEVFALDALLLPLLASLLSAAIMRRKKN